MPAAPTINKCLKGLLMDYVRLHGSEALAPMRKEPLTNAQTTSMLTVKNGTCIGKRTVVDWESNVFVSFACLLAGLRHTGGRKADHLPVKAAEFDGRHMRRSNLRWKLRNKLYADPPHELLADLQPGDCAVLAPASSKNDPTGTTFGDRPMHLPFVPHDITNAAAWYARLELRMPVKGNARKTTPLYTVGNMISLDHATADKLFNQLSISALGEDAAAALSLHSGRVWLACALLEQNYSYATIQAMCRWKTEESVKIYAHMQAEEYTKNLLAAISANVDASLVRSLPTLDSDGRFAALQHQVQQLAARVGSAAGSAAPTEAPPLIVDQATPDAESDDDGESDDEDEPELETCAAGAHLPADLVAVGQRVAVPFRIDSVEAFCPGSISSVAASRVFVEFADGKWQVARERLFAIAK